MIHGVEQLVSYLWQAWIRNGRRCEAMPSTLGWKLRLTARYVGSLTMVLATTSFLSGWLLKLVVDYPNEPALMVLAGAAILLWLLAAAGTANAWSERIEVGPMGIFRSSLTGKSAMLWEQIDSYRYRNGGDVFLIDAHGDALRVNSFLDGLGTLLAHLQAHCFVPPEVESRLACR